MDPDFSELTAALDDAGHGGYLLDADSSLSNQRYLSGFDASDPFLTLYTGGDIVVLTTTMEYPRAREQSRADVVRRFSDFDYRKRVETHGEARARSLVIADFLDAYEVTSVAVNRRFPLFVADGLRDSGVTVEPDQDDVLEDIRARKHPEEIAHIREAQRATEAAMEVTESLIRSASSDSGGRLVLEEEPVTSERVKTAIERELLERGYALDETIVASGTESAVPHDRGSGPIHANEPIIVDIFPRSKSTQYHADLTRTFVKGTPDPTIEEFYELTQEAKSAALEAIGPGVTGAEVHDAVCNVYEDAGYPTLRTDESTERGFVHGTGHGVGLDIHERPRLASAGPELAPGNVVTIEPGLYDPEVGGVRIEDLVVVTDDGFENLTEYEETLCVSEE
ncbi:MAG: M24 family metallopeptidase [Halodesulfurarchaeum sp.]